MRALSTGSSRHGQGLLRLARWQLPSSERFWLKRPLHGAFRAGRELLEVVVYGASATTVHAGSLRLEMGGNAGKESDKSNRHRGQYLRFLSTHTSIARSHAALAAATPLETHTCPAPRDSRASTMGEHYVPKAPAPVDAANAPGGHDQHWLRLARGSRANPRFGQRSPRSPPPLPQLHHAPPRLTPRLPRRHHPPPQFRQPQRLCPRRRSARRRP